MPSDYYHTSGSRSHAQHDRQLPPIRDVVGDELDRRARTDPYAFGDVRGALPTSSIYPQPGHSNGRDAQLQRGPTLPPINHTGYTSSRGAGSSGSQGRYSSEYVSAPSSQRGAQQTDLRMQDPDYAYGVLRQSGTGSSLVHAIPPAPRAQGILRQGGAPQQTYEQEPEKRHKCEYCGKKFDRPSSLQVHLRTHTGSQPFACEWPGCDRTFSVRSNMLRHWRSHEKNEVSRYPPPGRGADQDDEDELDEDYPGKKTSSSSAGQSSGSYYSSSRRR